MLAHLTAILHNHLLYSCGLRLKDTNEGHFPKSEDRTASTPKLRPTAEQENPRTALRDAAHCVCLLSLHLWLKISEQHASFSFFSTIPSLMNIILYRKCVQCPFLSHPLQKPGRGLWDQNTSIQPPDWFSGALSPQHTLRKNTRTHAQEPALLRQQRAYRCV